MIQRRLLWHLDAEDHAVRPYVGALPATAPSLEGLDAAVETWAAAATGERKATGAFPVLKASWLLEHVRFQRCQDLPQDAMALHTEMDTVLFVSHRWRSVSVCGLPCCLCVVFCVVCVCVKIFVSCGRKWCDVHVGVDMAVEL